MDMAMADSVDLGLSKEYGQWHFQNIPVEILLHICSFLDAKFISESLRVVCSRFFDILNDESIWKARVFKRCKKGASYPALPVPSDDFDWQLACIEVEYHYNFWKNTEKPVKHYLYNSIHYATVDAIHLMKNGSVCVSGSRDRSIVVWNVNHIKEDQQPLFDVYAKAHHGWIWNFTSSGDKLYSCSWDTKVCCWSIEQTLEETESYKCENAVLSLAVEGNTLVAGLYNSKVVVFDVRKKTPAFHYFPHKRSVLALTMDSQYVISASEDQTVAVWDHRAGKIYKDKVALYVENHEDDDEVESDLGVLRMKGFPMCLSYKNNQLYVGDSNGYLHLVDAAHGKFACVKSNDIGHTGKLTSVDHDTGYLITGSLDGTVRIFTPTTQPELISSVRSQGGEVTGLAYKNNVLAIGGTNNAVEILTI